ncbi:MAG TPA: twin-arginine translocation signal domain-containing protein [Thermoanaerobaculia bacterium]
MSEKKEAATSRRQFLVGATAAVALTTTGNAAAAGFPCGGDIAKTAIGDTLNAAEKKMLTPAAAKLTEKDVLLYNWAKAGHGKSSVQLADEDVKSLERAFIARDKRLYNLKDQAASLAPNLAVEALGSDCCCCCCPASCCSAAAETKPVRSRRVFA